MGLKMVFLIILAAVSVFYLITLFFKDGLLQFILKGCLLPLILAIYIFGAERILIPIVLALFFGWLGDVFLLKINNLLSFRLGLVSFLIGHLCYIAAMYNFAQPFNIPVLICGVAGALIVGFCIFKTIRPNAEMKIPVIFYEIVIITMVIFALQVFLANGGKFGSFVFAGSFCFMVSDSLLAYDTFRKKLKFGSFIIMLTYILAQLFITLGFCAAV